MKEILRCYIENFSEILFKCSTETWKRIATLYHDLLPNESGLDYFIDLVRRDTLDETVSLINLNKVGFLLTEQFLPELAPDWDQKSVCRYLVPVRS